MFEIIGLDGGADARAQTRGREYYRRHLVDDLVLSDECVKANVRGSNDNSYAVSIGVSDDLDIKLTTGTCTCPAYWEYQGACKHIVATALAAKDGIQRLIQERNRQKILDATGMTADEFFESVINRHATKKEQAEAASNQYTAAAKSAAARGNNRKPPTPKKRRSDRAATTLLHNKAQATAWDMEQTSKVQNSGKLAKLVPILALKQDYYEEPEWALTFKAGTDKLYVVMNLNEFKDDVLAGNVVSLGKADKLWVGREAFDQSGKETLDFLLKHHKLPPGYHEYYGGYKKEMHLDPAAADDLFALLAGGEIKFEYQEIIKVEAADDFDRYYYRRPQKKKQSRTLNVVADDYLLRLSLYRLGDGVELSCRDDFKLIEGLDRLHIISNDTLYNCSPAFSSACHDLLLTLQKETHDTRMLYFEESDTPALFTLLGELEQWLELDVEVGLERLVPPPLETRIYFDTTEQHDITAKMTFSYNSATHDAFAAKDTARSYDLAAEYRAEIMLLRYMGNLSLGSGTLLLPIDSDEADERLYVLATQGLLELEQLAEIFVSEEFKRMSVRPSATVSVGVKIDGDLLAVDFDVADLDYEDLAQALNAYKRKKRFVRLRDGSLLSVEDESIKQLAELTEGLELTEAELKAGSASMPVNRALYLDTLLRSNEELKYHRDNQLRGIVRAMRNVADADFAAPEVFEGVLRNYQKTGYRWLRTLEMLKFGGILADDMGLGKTIQVLALLQAAKDEAATNKTAEDKTATSSAAAPHTSIVVCPASLVLNWAEEALRFAPQLKVAPLICATRERHALIDKYEHYDLLVTSYHQLQRDIVNYKGKQFRFAVLDEAQMIKNQNTHNAKAVKLLEANTCLALTGTPVENSLAELWSIFDFLMPGYLRNYNQFKKKYEVPVTKNHDELATERLRSLVRPFILRRLKGDVLKELPEKIETVLRVTFEPEQEKLYRATLAQAKKELAAKLAEATGGQGQIAILAALTRMRQICCNPALIYADYKGGSAKTDAAMELIENSIEGGHRMLLFSQFTSMLDLLEDQLDARGIRYLRLDGSTSKIARQSLVAEFNSGDAPLFLISLKAGGTGLNLTGADVVIHYDPWWNLSVQNQATDRAHRIGQEKRVQVFKLIANSTIEERILKLQEQKAELAETVIKEGGNAFESLKADDLLALFAD